MQIALPSALALTADPIASLIDTAFIGHIGLWIVLTVPFYLFIFLFQKAFALFLSHFLLLFKLLNLM